jgi:hypothetical protein
VDEAQLMNALELLARCQFQELNILVAMAVAHAMGADTVAPGWLRIHCNQSDKTVLNNLQRLAAWGLAEQQTIRKWRLTNAGRQLELPVMTENFRLHPVDNSVDNSTGYVVDAVSLRRNFSVLALEDGNSPSSHSSSGGLSIKQVLDSEPPQPHNRGRKFSVLVTTEAERLAGILCKRIMASKAEALASIAERLDLGESADQLELSILLWCAYCLKGKGRNMPAAGRWIVKQIRTGEQAAPTERETLANASAGWGEQHPDLARVDELLEKLTVTESGNEQE